MQEAAKDWPTGHSPTFAKLTRKERDRVSAIAGRAALPMGRDRLDIIMDLSAVHAHTPLDFDRLLLFPDFDFFHDVGGIARHLNRTTGELEDCFLPRCARPERNAKPEPVEEASEVEAQQEVAAEEERLAEEEAEGDPHVEAEADEPEPGQGGSR